MTFALAPTRKVFTPPRPTFKICSEGRRSPTGRPQEVMVHVTIPSARDYVEGKRRQYIMMV